MQRGRRHCEASGSQVERTAESRPTEPAGASWTSRFPLDRRGRGRFAAPATAATAAAAARASNGLVRAERIVFEHDQPVRRVDAAAGCRPSVPTGSPLARSDTRRTFRSLAAPLAALSSFAAPGVVMSEGVPDQ